MLDFIDFPYFWNTVGVTTNSFFPQRTSKVNYLQFWYTDKLFLDQNFTQWSENLFMLARNDRLQCFSVIYLKWRWGAVLEAKGDSAVADLREFKALLWSWEWGPEHDCQPTSLWGYETREYKSSFKNWELVFYTVII